MYRDQVDQYESQYPELYLRPDLESEELVHNQELINSIKTVLDFLGGLQALGPSRRVADAKKLLLEKLDELEDLE